MAVPTVEDIRAYDFGYILGTDLLNYCPAQLLQKQEGIETGIIENGVITAYSEIKSQISTRYDIDSEFEKTTGRYMLVVKMTALSAIRNIVVNLAGIPDHLANNFKWLDDMLLSIRNGQTALTGVKVRETTIESGAYLVDSSFSTLG